MITTPPTLDDRYLSIDDLAAYAGLSARTLRRHLNDPDHPLPHFKVGGRVLVRRSDFDRWIERVGTPDHLTRAKTRDQRVREAVDSIVGGRSR